MSLIQALNEATERRLVAHGQLQYFEAERFVHTLEQEANRAASLGLSHVKVEMNVEDAGRLATFMRRALLLGA